MKSIKLGQVKTAAIISYIALAVNIVLSFFYTPWMVSKIGQANYGLYTLASSAINIFLLDFGLGSATSRFISKYRAENNQNAINDIVSAIFKLYILIDIFVFFILTILFVFLDVVYVKLSPTELEKFRILYIIVAMFSLISFPFSPLDGILNAYEKLIQLKFCSLFNKVFTVFSVILVLLFTNDVSAIIATNMVVGLLTIIIKLLIVNNKTNLKVNLRFKGKDTYKLLFSFTVWTMIISIMQRFTHSFAPSILAMTSGSVEIAIYSPAVMIESYFYLFSTAISGLFLPRVSRFIAQKKENEILNLAIRLGRYQIILLGLIFIGFLCIGKDFIVLWMGPEFSKTYYCTLIIILPTLISASFQIASTTIIAKNLVKYQAQCMIITGCLGLALSYLLSFFIGSVGVCFGTAITALLNIFYMNIVYIKKAGINMIEFYKKVYLKAFPCYILSALLSLFILSFININGWLSIIVKTIIIVLIYFTFIITIYFNFTEIKHLLSILRKVLRVNK